MQTVDDNLKRAAFSSSAGNRSSAGELLLLTDSKDEAEAAKRCGDHLLNLGKVNLPQHPIRMRHLPYTGQRILLYGNKGYQEMTLGQAPEVYSLQKILWQVQMCDCIQTSDLFLYVVARSHNSAVIACYDEFMVRQNFAEVSFPIGCLSSLATNHDCSYLYGANQELNCVLRFTADDLTLSKAERFGEAMWRPFDCCTSQMFTIPGGGQAQFLFVSNVDAGIFVFDIDTMEIVAECGDDLSPGAKFLAYDPKRSLLFISSSYDRQLRCYKFHAPQPPASCRPWLQKIGDFHVASRKPTIRSSGPQCLMWDPVTDQLAVISWSHAKGQFMTKVFQVNVKAQ